MRILAVDDDPLMLELLQVILQNAGCERVMVAESAAEAMTLVTRERKGIDCFLLDIEMPEKNGITLCAELRALPGHAKTPIIMVTAKADWTNIHRSFEAGATDYITKPFDVNEIAARVRVARQLNSVQNEIRAYRRSAMAYDRRGASGRDTSDAHDTSVTRQEVVELFADELEGLKRWNVALERRAQKRSGG